MVDLEAELLADLGEENHKVARLDQLEPVVKLALALRDELKEQLPKRHAVVRRGLRVGGEQAALICGAPVSLSARGGMYKVTRTFEARAALEGVEVERVLEEV